MDHLRRYQSLLRLFRFNPIIRLFIVNEILFWSVWLNLLPILGIYAATKIPGGNIESGVFCYTLYTIARVIGSSFSGFAFSKPKDETKIKLIITAIIILSVGYLGFAFAPSIFIFGASYTLAGIGLGMANPLRTSYFADHIDKDKEIIEWSMQENLILISTAFVSFLIGIFLANYSFNLLFIIAAVINLASLTPMLLLFKTIKQS